MTNTYNPDDDPLCLTGGWEEESRYKCGDTWFVNVRMVAVDPIEYSEEVHDKIHYNMATHQHRQELTRDCFDFEHEPTTQDVQEAVDATGFNPYRPSFISANTAYALTGNITLQDGVVQITSEPLLTKTEGLGDVLEYSAVENPVEFEELYAQVPIDVDERPTGIALKDDWIHLRYTRSGPVPPVQFFDKVYKLYSVRVHKDTGEVRRKGYDYGLTISDEAFSVLDGAPDRSAVLATGHWLDQDRVTLYHAYEGEENVVRDVAIVEVPYMGTTWENGVQVRTRRYTRESYEE